MLKQWSITVCIMSQHAINERNSEWLDVVVLDRHSFVVCALRAHMLLTETLIKDLFGCSIESGRVQKLKEPFLIQDASQLN